MSDDFSITPFNPILTVYDPPAFPMPYLAAAVFEDGRVIVEPFETGAEAHSFLAGGGFDHLREDRGSNG